LTRAGRLVLLLQGKRDPAATSRLLEVWRARDRSSAAQLVGSALVAIGSPEGLREVSEVLGALDVSVARVAARAFLAIDRGDAFDRAQRFFTSDDPASQRAASALFGALPLETSMDPRWLAYAADVPESSPLHRAASWCLERVREVRERTAAGQGEGPHGST
jgi:HEAT repeat protein